jgi:dTDP-4-amino-4,6-dideoxygalactose transaminase
MNKNITAGEGGCVVTNDDHLAARAEGIVTSPQGVSGLGGDYAKGACPMADSLFERSILLPIPSCLTAQDELDIIAAFGKGLRGNL